MRQQRHARLGTLTAVGIVLCVVLPMVIGVLITAGTYRPAPAPPPALSGHWVYVPSTGTAVHVDGATRTVDARVDVGSASAGSQVLADRRAGYLVDFDQVITFTPRAGVTGSAPAAGVAENPVPVEAAGTAFLVYRTAGMVMRLGTHPATVPVGGPVDDPVATPSGDLWVYRMDTGDLCVVGAVATSCPARAPAGHVGALAVRDGSAVFVDLTAGTWQPVGARGLGRASTLGGPLPADAEVGTGSVAGQLAVVDPDGRRLYLVSGRGGVITVPLGSGHYGQPVASRDAVAVVDSDTGQVISYGADGRRRGTMPLAGGTITLSTGDDGRVYADPADGLQSVVMDYDGTLTAIRTTRRSPPAYQSPPPVAPVSLPPATVATTAPETIPSGPDTVTVSASPTTTGAPSGGGATSGPGGSGSGSGSGRPSRPPTMSPPGPPPGSPVVDVLGATVSGPNQATVQLRVTGDGPVFCHVFFNSVERAATNCAGTMSVAVADLPPSTVFDVYVIGTNAKGTGNPGRRGVLRD